MGFDLNRHWHDPSLWAHPTLHATKKLLMDYDQNPVSNVYIVHVYMYDIVQVYLYGGLLFTAVDRDISHLLPLSTLNNTILCLVVALVQQNHKSS